MRHPSPVILDNRFRLQSRAGDGGQGQVIEAWDLRDARTVAVKFQHSRAFETSESYARYAREIHDEACTGMSLAGIDGIPSVLHRGMDSGRAYFAMEYVEGTTLADFIRDNRPLEEHIAAAIIGQLCEILDIVHAQGFVHRDLKPENIMLDATGAAWLIDVGLALRMSSTRHDAAGTHGYAAPEQYDADSPLTGRTDVFGLGCVLLEMCRQTPPFVGLQARPTLGSTVYPDWMPDTMPTLLRDLAYDMIALAEHERPGSAFAVFERLRPALPTKGDPPPAKVTNPDATAWYRSGRSRWQ